MNDTKEHALADNLKPSQRLSEITMAAKIALAGLILIAYFLNSTWLIELLVAGVVFNLLLPLGFYGGFLRRLIEYNTRKVEKRLSELEKRL